MAEQVDILDEVEDELFRFGRILDREPTLRSALTDPSLPDDRKTELLEALLGDRVQDATLVLVREVVLRPRGRTIDRGLEEYGRLAAARRERLVAQVRTAVPLTERAARTARRRRSQRGSAIPCSSTSSSTRSWSAA